MKEHLIKQICERGYWRINFRPTTYRRAIGTLQECRQLVETSSVEKRGWDYPHISVRNDESGGLELHDGFVQDWTDWQNHREFWRMYQSGQYLHYLALREDWLERDDWSVRSNAPAPVHPNNKHVTVLGVNWQITEVFEFLSRTAKQGIYDSGVDVSIRLHDTEGRKLLVDQGRSSFFPPRATSAPDITYSKTYSREEITDPKGLAILVVADFYDRFGWNPASDQIRSMQDELYALKLGRG